MIQEYRQKFLQRLIHTTLERKREALHLNEAGQRAFGSQALELTASLYGRSRRVWKNTANLATSGVALAEVLPKLPP
jgi:hypothetical protein